MPQVIPNDNTGKGLLKRVSSDFVLSEHLLIISFFGEVSAHRRYFH